MMQRADRFSLFELFSIFITTLFCSVVLLTVSNHLLRVPAGILLALIIPGYLLLKFIYPNDNGDNYLWRISLFIPSSIALTSVILLGMNYFWVYKFQYSVLILVIVNLMIGFGLVLARFKSRKLSISSSWLMAAYDNLKSLHRNGQKNTNLLMLASLLFFIGSLIYAIFVPKQTDLMTEFYILSPSRTITNSILVDNKFKYGVINKEGKDIEYRVVVLTKSATNSKEWWSEIVFVESGETIERDVTPPLIPHGTQEIQILLFLNGESQPYRSLAIVVED